MENKDLNELRNSMLQFLYDRLDYESSIKEIMKAIEFVEARIEPNSIEEKQKTLTDLIDQRIDERLDEIVKTVDEKLGEKIKRFSRL